MNCIFYCFFHNSLHPLECWSLPIQQLFLSTRTPIVDNANTCTQERKEKQRTKRETKNERHEYSFVYEVFNNKNPSDSSNPNNPSNRTQPNPTNPTTQTQPHPTHKQLTMVHKIQPTRYCLLPNVDPTIVPSTE